jgi:hypothetical protein
MKRKPLSPEHKRKISESLSGEKSYRWIGDDVGYRGVHDWVKKNLGKPTKCSNPDCTYPRKNSSRKIIHSPKRFEWANTDHKYRRKLEDYISLCTSCHRLYDYENHLSNKGSGTGSIKNKV